MAYRAGHWTWALLFRTYCRYCVPRRQPAACFIVTMGKVGTIAFKHALHRHGFDFVTVTHRIGRGGPEFPHTPPVQHTETRARRILYERHHPWLLRQRPVKVLTAVREPIERLVSLYLFVYPRLFGEPVETTPMEILLQRFPTFFETEYRYHLVPGDFFQREICHHLDIDVFAWNFPTEQGWGRIRQAGIDLLVLKLEAGHAAHCDGLSQWAERTITEIPITNTSSERGYGDIYAEFKQRVRIPFAYADALYRSAFMSHFYTEAERIAAWQRWEPQLDRTLVLPAWIQASLARHHPPATTRR